jgi:(1->4)-alpha-D-glucan 1-alpha-D-glucosylmutase
MTTCSIPVALYRLQFNKQFTFSQATELVPYLASLGISHVYASPYLRARPGSLHGYDIIDHHRLNPEIGSAEEYDRFVEALHQHGMGQILDIVPNHMGVMGSDNAWWLDVLENGQASAHADYFDIDWVPVKDELQGKVLAPVLGDHYGAVLDRGDLKLTFDSKNGEFSIFYFEHRFPVDPREYPRILGLGMDGLQQEVGGPEESSDESFVELRSLISAFHHLPDRGQFAAEQRAERLRDKEIHKRRLAALCEQSATVARWIEGNVLVLNGTPGAPGSFDALHELIKAQPYRLAFWPVAADDINYRRFFDINDLAALRQENDKVFHDTHEFVLQLLRDGKIDGLRIDHPDGLYNPREYFERLQASASGAGGNTKRCYIVAEKILTGDEALPENWPIHGTTGYNFVNLVNGLFVDPDGEQSAERTYCSFVRRHLDLRELLRECKKRVMDRWLNSELTVLANHLSRIALADRHTCDFTAKALRDALTEIVAEFPVYRTYVTEEKISATSRRCIQEAVNRAKAVSVATDSTVYDFIREVLLAELGEGRSPSYKCSAVQFAMRFQQYTSALMAKGLEDTCFYRYNRLVSLNEVGGNLFRFGVPPQEFHRKIQERARLWPDELVTTSTHDTKRSEDVRARINVLSELPLAWRRQVRIWRKLNRDKKSMCNGKEAPEPNVEYLLYQTLVGAWPFEIAGQSPPPAFRDRICSYMTKAVREAMDQTSWAKHNQVYESAVTHFVSSILQSKEFLQVFAPFQRKIAYFGMLNSLSQTLTKLTVPGVPDIYQGNELWALNLVDPDNRRPVEYAVRRDVLRRMLTLDGGQCNELSVDLLRNMEDGWIKLYVIWKTLDLRNRNPNLFRYGTYIPLESLGENAKHVVAFARVHETGTAIVAVPRLIAQLMKCETVLPRGCEVWRGTTIQLLFKPKTGLRNLFTGNLIRVQDSGHCTTLSAKDLFADFPVALLA